jgi:hypothetical protein
MEGFRLRSKNRPVVVVVNKPVHVNNQLGGVVRISQNVGDFKALHPLQNATRRVRRGYPRLKWGSQQPEAATIDKARTGSHLICNGRANHI